MKSLYSTKMVFLVDASSLDVYTLIPVVVFMTIFKFAILARQNWHNRILQTQV